MIILAVLVIVLTIALNETWKKKEHYRCRVFELSKGEEGSNLVKVIPDMAPPPPPKRPLLTDWLSADGEYFKRGAVVALTENPNKTVNVILINGKSINTGLFIDEIKKVLDINFSCTVREELRYKKQLWGENKDL